ncbi:hypothetical protein ABZM97_09570 [Bacillus vallismortis]|uniref:hypothetical protein n=1 Tax=Bacillus vallismortis TaxID=72361 RepID=UPI00345F22EE
MKNSDLDFKKQHLKKLIFSGFISAMHSHKTLFKTVLSDNSTLDLSVALAYLSEAHNYHVNAETFYLDNIELFGERSEIETLLQHFFVYNDEFLSNARTDHSHQWSDIEFRKFAESFKPAAELLNIKDIDYWVNQALSDEE